MADRGEASSNRRQLEWEHVAVPELAPCRASDWPLSIATGAKIDAE